MTIEKIKTRTSEMWLGEDGIIRVIHFRGTEVSLADIKEINGHLARLSGGKKMPIVDDIRGVKSVSREARLFTSSADAVQVGQAAALIIGSPVSKVIGNFFLGINKPPYPTRLFTSEEEAIKWLKGFVEKGAAPPAQDGPGSFKTDNHDDKDRRFCTLLQDAGKEQNQER